MPNINFLDESEMSDMNSAENRRIDDLEKKIDNFIKSLEEKFDRWDELYYAFTGNKLDSKAGIMNRIIELETAAKINEARLKKLEDDHLKIISYAMALSFAVSSLVTAASIYKIIGG